MDLLRTVGEVSLRYPVQFVDPLHTSRQAQSFRLRILARLFDMVKPHSVNNIIFSFDIFIFGILYIFLYIVL